MSDTQITVASEHGFCNGDLIAISTIDKRWFIRFYCWIFRLTLPKKMVIKKIKITSSNTFTATFTYEA